MLLKLPLWLWRAGRCVTWTRYVCVSQPGILKLLHKFRKIGCNNSVMGNRGHRFDQGSHWITYSGSQGEKCKGIWTRVPLDFSIFYFAGCWLSFFFFMNFVFSVLISFWCLHAETDKNVLIFIWMMRESRSSLQAAISQIIPNFSVVCTNSRVLWWLELKPLF